MTPEAEKAILNRRIMAKLCETNKEISTAIIVLIKSGSSLESAFDLVLGEGAYAKLAGDVYDAFRVAGAK